MVRVYALLGICVLLLHEYSASVQPADPFASHISSWKNITNCNDFFCDNRGGKDDFTKVQCRCDAECPRYGDCCWDFAQRNTSTLISRDDRWQCKPLNYLYKTYSYMISTCPSNYKNDEVVRYCTKTDLDATGYDYRVDLPVISYSTNITYGNAWCALCNKDMNLQPFNLSFLCNVQLNMSTEEFVSAAKYSPGSQKWTIPHHTADDEDAPSCALDSLYDTSYVGRYCGSMTERKGCEENDVEYCGVYALYINYNKTIEKNPHCAACANGKLNWNGVKKCIRIHIGKRSKYYKEKPPFSLLFDFNGDEYLGYTSACAPEEIYDTVKEACELMPNVTCDEGLLRANDYVVLANGSLYVNATMRLYTDNEYENVSNVMCLRDSFGRLQFKFSHVQSYISIGALSISIFCLVLHMMLYTTFAKWHNLPGKNLLSLTIALFVAQVLFLFGIDQTDIQLVCEIIGQSIHYFYLVAFFWMNVMSFDVFCTFRKSVHHDPPRVTFCKYSLYAWTVPFAIVGIAVLVDHLGFVEDIRPHYGVPNCWINRRLGLIVFFTVPVAATLISNCIFFVLTVLAIRTQSRAARFANTRNETIHTGSSSPLTVANRKKIKNDRLTFALYAKLGLLMGLTWIFGFVAALADIPFLWYPFLILNGAQGALIFIGFDMKPKVLRNAWDNLTRKKMGRSSTVVTPGSNRATGSTRSSSHTITSTLSQKHVSAFVASDDKDSRTPMLKTFHRTTDNM